ncbi:hypothetical protein HMPREF9517_00939 [Enterococcus faecalis TX1341]|nr:hypothetical protein HMPREF9517_00939 [Enterococcus faecalis TX1341]
MKRSQTRSQKIPLSIFKDELVIELIRLLLWLLTIKFNKY